MESATFKFLGFRVSEFEFKVADSYLTEPGAQHDLAVRIEQIVPEDNNRVVEIAIIVNVKETKDGLHLKMTIKGGFIAEKDTPQDVFDNFCQLNAPAILFPYARAVISNFTTQAGILPVILPLVNLTKANQVNEKESQ